MRQQIDHLGATQRVREFGVAARRKLQPGIAIAVGIANQFLKPVSQRAGVFTKSPQASEIVANYARGWVLFGLSFGGIQGLEWHRFSQRAVITPEWARIPKRMRHIQRRENLEVRFDEDFERILELCREGRSGWLSDEAVDAYRRVHQFGFTATVSTYRDGRLVGGMWGITVGRTFGIMSAFHLEDHAGSLALVAAIERVIADDRWSMVDSMVINDHYKRFGAREVPTEEFCDLMWRSMPPMR